MTECPDEKIVDTRDYKRQAWLDYQLPISERKGMMSCYCSAQYDLHTYDAFFHSFDDVHDDETAKGDNLCHEYLKMRVLDDGLTYGTSIFLMTVNTVMCMIMSAMVIFEKHHSLNDLTMS